MFVSDKKEIGLSEEINLNPNEKLINLCVPHIITLRVTSIEKTSLRDFVGLDNCDEATRKTVMNFTLNVALGKMDDAFRLISVPIQK